MPGAILKARRIRRIERMEMEKIPVRNIRATQKDTTFSESFSIRDGADLLAGKDMIQELHRHDFFYVLALEKGAGYHEIDFIPYEVCDHSVFFMRPGQVHQLVLKAGSTGFLMQFKAGLYAPKDKIRSQLLRKAGSTNLYQPGATGFKKLQAVLTSIFQEYTEQQQGYQEVIKANLTVFLVELARLNNTGSPNKVSTYMQERLEHFLELLETHIASHKQVSQYADMLNLSPWQLNAITKATLDKTCSELIQEYIILEAKRYLLATSGQVIQIAGHLGYEDISYFIRFFKKHTGYSPEVFRHNFR